MTVSPVHLYAPLLIAALLTACSGQGSGQESARTATVAAAQPASVLPAPAGTVAVADATDRGKVETDDASASPAVVPAAPHAASSTAMPPPAGSAAPPPAGSAVAFAAQTNQPNQAILAQQAESATEAPAATAVAGSDQAQAMATHKNDYVALQHTAQAALVHHAIADTSLVHPSLAPQQIAQAPTGLNAQSVKALRQRAFTSQLTRFNRPAMLAHTDTLAAPPPPMRTMSLKVGAIGISNFDNLARVNFALKTFGNDWTNDFIDPRDTQEFGCGFPEDCLFWMQTGDKPPVYYAMHHDHRYAIFWDQGKASWDLRLAVQDP